MAHVPPTKYPARGAPARGSWATHPLEHQIAFINNERRRLQNIENTDDNGVLLVVMLGESNSGGYAVNADLTATELAARSGVQIWHNASDEFQDLDVGTNNLISHTALTDNATHGFEAGFANTVAAGRWGRSQIYLLKTGQGGSTVAQWEDGNGSGYLSTAESRISDVLTALDGYSVTPIIVLSLGSNDSGGGTTEANYKNGLTALVSAIRTALGVSDAHVYITRLMAYYSTYNGYIDDWATADGNATPFDVSDDNLRDSNHWSAQGFRIGAENLLDEYNGASGTLAAPTMDPAGGTFVTAPEVTISGPAGASIYYTTDGSTPTTGGTSAVYSAPIQTSFDDTIKAIAVLAGWANSTVASETYAELATASVWGDKGTLAVLTDSDAVLGTATDSAFTGGRGTTGKSSGGWYFEIYLEAYPNPDVGIITGICDGVTAAGAGLDTYTGNFSGSRGLRDDTFAAANGAITGVAAHSWTQATGGVIMHAVDATNGSHWIGYNGVWRSSITPVMASTTGRVSSFTGGLTVYPAGSVYRTANQIRLVTAAADLTYSPPSGFTAWG